MSAPQTQGGSAVSTTGNPTFDAHLDRFVAAVGTSSSPSTTKTYQRHAEVFLKFVADNGWDLVSMPADAPSRLYAWKKWAPATGNIWSSGLVAFERWANSCEIPIVALEYPARVKTPKKPKKPKNTVPETAAPDLFGRAPSTNPLDPVHHQETHVPETIASNSNGHAFAAAGSPEDPIDGELDEDFNRSDAPPTAPPTRPVTPVPSPAEQTPRSRVTSRNQRTKDPLADFMPPGGFLRISKRSPGDPGGLAAGKIALIGDYGVNDMMGMTDPTAFINKHLRGVHGPFPGERDLIYVVARHGADGNQLQGGQEIPFAAPRSMNSPSTGSTHSQSWGVHGDRVTYLEQKLVEAQERERTESETKTANLLAEIQRLQNPTPIAPGIPVAAPRVFTETEIRSMIDAATRSVDRTGVERAERELAAERRRTTPQTQPDNDFGFDGFDAPARASAPSGGNDKAVDRLADANERLLQAVLAKEERVPAAVATTPVSSEDAEERVMRKFKMMREMFAPPPSTGPSADVLALKEMVMQQGNQITRLAEQVASGGNLNGEIVKMRAMKALAEEVVGMSGQGEPSWKEVFPDIMKEVGGMVKAVFGGQVAQQRQTVAGQVAAPAAIPAAPPQSQVPPPAAATSALLGLRDIDQKSPDFEKAVVNGFFSLLSALSTAPAINGAPNPWVKVKDVILSALKQAQVKAQLTALVVDTFALCGRQDAIGKPGLVDGVTHVLWMRYHEIHASIWGAERFLADRPDARVVVPAPAAPAAQAAPTPEPAGEPGDLKPPAVDPASANPNAFRQPKAPAVAPSEQAAGPPVVLSDVQQEAARVDAGGAPLMPPHTDTAPIRVADLSPEEAEKLCDWVNEEKNPCRRLLAHEGDHDWDVESVMEEGDVTDEDADDGDDAGDVDGEEE